MKSTWYRGEEITVKQNEITGDWHYYTSEATSDQRATWYQQVVMVPDDGYKSAAEAIAAAKNQIDRTEEAMDTEA